MLQKNDLKRIKCGYDCPALGAGWRTSCDTMRTLGKCLKYANRKR